MGFISRSHRWAVSHHLATFRSYTELQLEMGHRSADLLRTRYVAMEGLLHYHRGESILVVG